MNKYIIIFIIIFIIIVIYIIINKNKSYIVIENNYILNSKKLNNIYLIDKSKIKINNNDLIYIPQLININTIKIYFLNFSNNNITINMNINGIENNLIIKPFYSNIILTNNNFKPIDEIKTSIPKIIMQTNKSRYVTNNKYLSVRSIIDNNPNYDYNFFDDNEAKLFIQKYYDNNVVNAYDSLIPGAYKADLFRYCYLYINGGIYIDCKMICHINFDELYDNDYDLIVVQDRIPNAYWNGFICAKPQLEVFKKCINKIVENVKNKYYGINPLDVTGPILFYNIIKNEANLQLKILHITKFKFYDPKNYIFDNNNKKLLNILYPNYYLENNYRITNHYDKLWNNKNIFK
jgi:mannosyltransferase OCH1-like enzyme